MHGDAATGSGPEKSADPLLLLIEDDPDDIHVITKILDRAPIPIDVAICSHGREALEFLRGTGRPDQVRRPDLILLDLNMPVMDGNTFLTEVRSDPDTATIPICVFTTSTDVQIIRRAYEDGANAVVSKTDSLAGMSRIINSIVDFWLRTAARSEAPAPAGVPTLPSGREET
jgi:CheY-like chemotaxis protein